MPPHDYVPQSEHIHCSENARQDRQEIYRRLGLLEVDMGITKAEVRSFSEIAKDTNGKIRWLAVEILGLAILIPVLQKILGSL
jgi:hypothetical protein